MSKAVDPEVREAVERKAEEITEQLTTGELSWIDLAAADYEAGGWPPEIILRRAKAGLQKTVETDLTRAAEDAKGDDPLTDDERALVSTETRALAARTYAYGDDVELCVFDILEQAYRRGSEAAKAGIVQPSEKRSCSLILREAWQAFCLEVRVSLDRTRPLSKLFLPLVGSMLPVYAVALNTNRKAFVDSVGLHTSPGKETLIARAQQAGLVDKIEDAQLDDVQDLFWQHIASVVGRWLTDKSPDDESTKTFIDKTAGVPTGLLVGDVIRQVDVASALLEDQGLREIAGELRLLDPPWPLDRLQDTLRTLLERWPGRENRQRETMEGLGQILWGRKPLGQHTWTPEEDTTKSGKG